ncbi:hypothetical protein ACSVC9_03405 [Clostridium sp. LBM24168]
MSKKRKRLIIFIVIFVVTLICIIYYYTSRKNNNSIKQNNDKKSTQISKERSLHKIQKVKPSSESKSSDNNSNNHNNQNIAVTESSAVKLVKYRVKGNNPNASFTFDHNEIKDNAEYYVIHAFDSMEDHGATIGWYYVNKSNGKVYEYDLVNNKLSLMP